MSETLTCYTDPAVLRRERQQARAERRRRLALALAQGPATARGLADRMGEHVWRCETHHFHDDGTHHVELDDYTYTSRYSAESISKDLRLRERDGAVGRVIVDGWQAQLWYAK